MKITITEELKNDLKVALERQLPNVTISFTTLSHTNLDMTGVVFRTGYNSLAPSLHLDNYLQDVVDDIPEGCIMCESMIIDKVAKVMIQAYHDCMNSDEFVSQTNLVNNITTLVTDYSKCCDRIGLKLINKELNTTLLENCIWFKSVFPDLVLIPYIDLGNGALTNITKDMFLTWTNKNPMSQKEIFDRATSNIRHNYVCQSLSEMFGIPNGACPMYVVTNTEHFYGASCLESTALLNALKDTLGDDFYIIPSSVHAMIILPAKAVSDIGEVSYLSNMISDINNDVVDTNVFLSNNLYMFSDGHITIVNK